MRKNIKKKKPSKKTTPNISELYEKRHNSSDFIGFVNISYFEAIEKKKDSSFLSQEKKHSEKNNKEKSKSKNNYKLII